MCRQFSIGRSFVLVSLLTLPMIPLAANDPLMGVGFAMENMDANGDLERDVSDGIYFLSHLFLGGPAPVPLAYCGSEPTAVVNGDSNGDGLLDISDALHMLGWLFGDGPSPVAPCGDGGQRNPNPRVIPRHARPYGKTYGEWAASWWQWTLSLPQEGHPIFDPTGENCGAGQSGPVWNLGLPFPGTEVTRRCTVPTGKSILCPVRMFECSTIPEDGDFSNEDELRACNDERVQSSADCVAMEAYVDGVPIENVADYMVTSPLFDVGPLPEGNEFGSPAGTTGQAIASAWFFLLAPLSAGEHEIHLRGTILPPCTPGPIVGDLTYFITVAP